MSLYKVEHASGTAWVDTTQIVMVATGCPQGDVVVELSTGSRLAFMCKRRELSQDEIFERIKDELDAQERAARARDEPMMEMRHVRELLLTQRYANNPRVPVETAEELLARVMKDLLS